MKKDVSVTPGGITVMGARIGALVAAMFFVFGLTLGYVVLQAMGSGDDGERLITMMFFVMWAVVCGLLVFFLLRIGFGKGAAKDDSLVNLKIGDTDSRKADGPGD